MIRKHISFEPIAIWKEVDAAKGPHAHRRYRNNEIYIVQFLSCEREFAWQEEKNWIKSNEININPAEQP